MSLTHPPSVGHTSQLKNADISSRSPDRLKPIATRCYFLRLTSIPQSPAPSRPSLPNIPTPTQHSTGPPPSLLFPSHPPGRGRRRGPRAWWRCKPVGARRETRLRRCSVSHPTPPRLRLFVSSRAGGPRGVTRGSAGNVRTMLAVTCNLTVNCNTLTVITLTCSWMILSNSVLCCPLLTSVSPHSLFPSKHARPVRRSATGRCSGGRWRLSGCSSRRMEMLMYLLFISCTRPSVQFQLY